MPLCGFNEKMLEGLRMFNEGLFEHGLIERSKVKGIFVEDTLARELAEMDGFLRETGQINNQAVREVIEGLTLYARGVYGLMRGKNVSQYPAVVQQLHTLFVEMDEVYYSQLEGKPHAMADLVYWINQRN